VQKVFDVSPAATLSNSRGRAWHGSIPLRHRVKKLAGAIKNKFLVSHFHLYIRISPFPSLLLNPCISFENSLLDLWEGLPTFKPPDITHFTALGSFPSSYRLFMFASFPFLSLSPSPLLTQPTVEARQYLLSNLNLLIIFINHQQLLLNHHV